MRLEPPPDDARNGTGGGFAFAIRPVVHAPATFVKLAQLRVAFGWIVSVLAQTRLEIAR
jgi:hypothetical protein